MKRKIITLCGSTRFYEHFQRANYELTMQGHIVLSVGFIPYANHGEKVACTPEQKIQLDELHFDKIAMSDEIYVLNVDGYVGESTFNEIAWANALKLPVRWLDEARSIGWLVDHADELVGRVVAFRSAVEKRSVQ